MKSIPFEIGRVAVSKQGHDKGDWFVVVGIVDERHVLISDGRLRKLEKPKKKQTKHLQAKPVLAEGIVKAITEGKPLVDSDVRKAVMAASGEEQNQTQAEGDTLGQQKEECALVQE